ncbi:uncharacterized protein LOC134778014 [Penaeus indicus]|uniref:uncharacterized protein LOC134778014 n=1 Tax=Penaeus indicus TaxID=29960 RepID=UPI00300CEA3C
MGFGENLHTPGNQSEKQQQVHRIAFTDNGIRSGAGRPREPAVGENEPSPGAAVQQGLPRSHALHSMARGRRARTTQWMRGPPSARDCAGDGRSSHGRRNRVEQPTNPPRGSTAERLKPTDQAPAARIVSRLEHHLQDRPRVVKRNPEQAEGLTKRLHSSQDTEHGTEKYEQGTRNTEQRSTTKGKGTRNGEVRTRDTEQRSTNKGKGTRKREVRTRNTEHGTEKYEQGTRNREVRIREKEHGIQNSEHRTRNTEQRSRKAEHGPRNAQVGTRNSDRKCQNTKRNSRYT